MMVLPLLVTSLANQQCLDQAENLMSKDKMFKVIFDNCKQPIVIIKHQQALYANNQFMA